MADLEPVQHTLSAKLRRMRIGVDDPQRVRMFIHMAADRLETQDANVAALAAQLAAAEAALADATRPKDGGVSTRFKKSTIPS
jgi:hypothetical protein